MPLPRGAAWPLCQLNISKGERKGQADSEMPVHHAAACPGRPPSHFKTLLLGDYLSGKLIDDLKDVEPDLDVITKFLLSFIGAHTMC